MPAVAGRSTDGRTITVTTTNASTALTAAAGTFDPGDVGRTITATGIPAGATIASVTSGTAATLSANATATGSRSAVLGKGDPATLGFQGWSPTTDAENQTFKSPSTAPAGWPLGQDRPEQRSRA